MILNWYKYKVVNFINQIYLTVFLSLGVGPSYIVVTQYLNPVFALNKGLNGIFLIPKSVF